MNVDSNTTTGASSPMEEIRRLQKELSERLAEHNEGRWFSLVMPAGGKVHPHWLGSWPLSSSPEELPIDKVTRLAWELADALDQYEAGKYLAMVVPASVSGNAVMLQIRMGALV